MLGERLRTLREQRGANEGRKLYQRDVAKMLDIKEETYRSYEYGRAQLPEDKAKRLAAEWGISWKSFYDATGLKPHREVSEFLAPEPQVLANVPFVGNVGANSKVDWLDPIEAAEFVEVPPEMATARGPQSLRFACKVVGDSCFDLIWPEDLCIFHKSDIPKIGAMVLYRSFDDHVTIKQLKHNGTDYYLHALNSKYEDVPVDGGVQVGYLVGIIRQQGSKRVTVYDPNGITP